MVGCKVRTRCLQTTHLDISKQSAGSNKIEILAVNCNLAIKIATGEGCGSALQAQSHRPSLILSTSLLLRTGAFATASHLSHLGLGATAHPTSWPLDHDASPRGALLSSPTTRMKSPSHPPAIAKSRRNHHLKNQSRPSSGVGLHAHRCRLRLLLLNHPPLPSEFVDA